MKPLEYFNNQLNDVSILNEYSFMELYPWYYFDATEKLKKEIVNNLTKLQENQFNAYLNYTKEQIKEFHVFDPEICIIQQWLDKFDIAPEDFPFIENHGVKLLTQSKYKDDSFGKEQNRLVYSIQREFHLYAVFLEVEKIVTFINEFLIKTGDDSVGLVSNPKILKGNLDYKKEAWFKIGLLFATGEMDALLLKFDSNGTQIAKNLGNKKGFRPYITESIGINKSTSVKSVFSNKDKMNKIILHCEENNIQVVPSFLNLLPID
jgi:hypothetical protein